MPGIKSTEHGLELINGLDQAQSILRGLRSLAHAAGWDSNKIEVALDKIQAAQKAIAQTAQNIPRR